MVFSVVMKLIRSLLNNSKMGINNKIILLAAERKINRGRQQFEKFALVFSSCIFYVFSGAPREHRKSHADDSADACQEGREYITSADRYPCSGRAGSLNIKQPWESDPVTFQVRRVKAGNYPAAPTQVFNERRIGSINKSPSLKNHLHFYG